METPAPRRRSTDKIVSLDQELLDYILQTVDQLDGLTQRLTKFVEVHGMNEKDIDATG